MLTIEKPNSILFFQALSHNFNKNKIITAPLIYCPGYCYITKLTNISCLVISMQS